MESSASLSFLKLCLPEWTDVESTRFNQLVNDDSIDLNSQDEDGWLTAWICYLRNIITVAEIEIEAASFFKLC